MSAPAATEAATEATAQGTRERLAGWLHRLEQVLPAQAPLRDFVHHNTLHGLQHLPFAEALGVARHLTGAQPWLAAANCRALFAAGRISLDDLAAALAEAGIEALAEALPGLPQLSRRDVLIAAFRHDVAPVSAARRAWLLGEGGALARPLPGGMLPAAELPALWEACGEALGLVAKAAPNAALDALFADIDIGGGKRKENDEDADHAWMIPARALWSLLVDRLGREWTLAALLERLTGENVLDAVRPTLIRHLAAHLDRGIAGWRNPRRGEGFYAAWRASAGADLGWELDEWLAARDEIARLPDDPLDAIERELLHLGPDEAHWGDYLERLALELPGWSGMFLRCAGEHPEQEAEPKTDAHASSHTEAPVAMADYLAVRLVLERICSEELVHRIWGLPLFLSELGDYFLCHPAELKVRHDFFAGLLAEADAHAARQLIASGGGDDEWVALARQIGRHDAVAARRESRRWSLFALAQHLGLDAATLLAAGRAGADALLTTALDAPGEDTRGHVWLLAYERRYREQVFAALAANRGRGAPPAQPAAQLVFCMDDREEGTRRHLEEVNPAIETFGAAGFFGVPMYWQGIDDAAPGALAPVVVKPQNEVREQPAAGAEDVFARYRQRRALQREWQDRLHRATRGGLVAGPLLTALAAPFAAAAMVLQALLPGAFGEMRRRQRDAFAPPPPTRAALAYAAIEVADAPPAHGARAGFSDDEQATRVAAFLASIGLTRRFAPLVAIVGHGSNSSNNPHAAAYDCGACAGRHGGPNARVFATMANRAEVRARLVAQHGIAIPDGTWFLGCEHNTGDERLTWFDRDLLPEARTADFVALCGDLAEATRRHAVERCRRFASAPPQPPAARALRHLLGRRHDWAQARPELGHATVAVGIIGRRALSRGTFLDRRSFLISYDPESDADGRILESLLLAAAPVGAGIALEYYFSTVDNRRFGCGSKVTHNLAGGVGVMEGTASDLRTGLPLQMIEIHEPMRLLVVIEQTPPLLDALVARQPALRELIANGWIVVASCAPESGALSRLDPARGWQDWPEGAAAPVPRARDSADWLGAHREPLPPALLGAAVAAPLAQRAADGAGRAGR